MISSLKLLGHIAVEATVLPKLPSQDAPKTTTHRPTTNMQQRPRPPRQNPQATRPWAPSAQPPPPVTPPSRPQQTNTTADCSLPNHYNQISCLVPQYHVRKHGKSQKTPQPAHHRPAPPAQRPLNARNAQATPRSTNRNTPSLTRTTPTPLSKYRKP